MSGGEEVLSLKMKAMRTRENSAPAAIMLQKQADLKSAHFRMYAAGKRMGTCCRVLSRFGVSEIPFPARSFLIEQIPDAAGRT